MFQPATYLLQCSDGSFYTGVTSNLEQRIAQHNEGFYPHCYTVKRRPLELVYVDFFGTMQDAIEREKQIKTWSRKKKEALIKENYWLLQEYSKKKERQITNKPIKPQIGVDVIIEGENGDILLIQRKDDGRWSLPGGWVKENETPDGAIKRETFEETGFVIELDNIGDVHVRQTGSVHITYFGHKKAGGLYPDSPEAKQILFRSLDEVKKWHADHEMRIKRAMERKIAEQKEEVT